MHGVGGENFIFPYTTFQKILLLPLSDESGYRPILLQPLDKANLSHNVTDQTQFVLQQQWYKQSRTAHRCVQFVSYCLS